MRMIPRKVSVTNLSPFFITSVFKCINMSFRVELHLKTRRKVPSCTNWLRNWQLPKRSEFWRNGRVIVDPLYFRPCTLTEIWFTDAFFFSFFYYTRANRIYGKRDDSVTSWMFENVSHDFINLQRDATRFPSMKMSRTTGVKLQPECHVWDRGIAKEISKIRSAIIPSRIRSSRARRTPETMSSPIPARRKCSSGTSFR